MAEKPSLALRRQSIEHLIAESGRDDADTIIIAAKEAALTLGFLERHQELSAMMARLEQQAPDVFGALSALAKSFPEARISGLRSTRFDPKQYGDGDGDTDTA
jgi:hypothetical protein